MALRSLLHRLVMIVCLGSAAMAGVGCATDAAVIDQANQMHSGLEPAVITDPHLAGYIQAVGERIIATAREMNRQNYGPSAHREEDSQWMYSKEMQFHFVNSKTLNAFTTGGEHMYIYTALFEQCKTEDELAAVMAHEYGHVYGRHIHKSMNRQYLVLGSAAAMGLVGYAAGGDKHGDEYASAFASAAVLVGNFIGMGYTRKDEAQADQMGFDFYVRAGWDPAHFADFFQGLIDKGMDTTPEILSDHPPLRDRVAAARERANQLPPAARNWRKPNVATPQQFAELKRWAIEVGQHMPDDKSLEKAQELLQALPRSCLTPVVQQDQQQAQQKIIDDLQRVEEQQRQADQAARRQSRSGH
ncbi:MAG: M48 family metalloprotease [Phycisphaerales bacterium]|jgi:predicted Zn-dependent protease|nr:M48 family metalloprotease [Phycisphaerales bacterium]